MEDTALANDSPIVKDDDVLSTSDVKADKIENGAE
jgi:hypothetical protein